ncbi:amidohydrolase [Cereibacter sp. SYSU M97828]|nr:amidohydrolase [Cereibacter flavus]
MEDLPIIDPHHHLWDLDLNCYPWLSDGVQPVAFGNYAPLQRNYLIADYRSDARGQNVVKSLHLDVGYDPIEPVGEARWLQAVADEHGFPHGIVGYADLAAPDVGDLLDAHLEHENFRGIRQSMNWHADLAKTYTDRPEISRSAEWQRGFAMLAPRSLSFKLQIYYSQVEEFLDLARAFPDTRIILNHAGMQMDGPEHFSGWRQGMSLLATAPNIACKISGLGMGKHDWTASDIRPYVEHFIEPFGIERCMFASNFPVDRLFSSFGAIFDAFREITANYTQSERRALFHDNAARFYRL